MEYWQSAIEATKKTKANRMKNILFLLTILCLTDSFAQDNKAKYWYYSGLMNQAMRNKDTSLQSRYLDSMSKYSKFDARNLKH